MIMLSIYKAKKLLLEMWRRLANHLRTLCILKPRFASTYHLEKEGVLDTVDMTYTHKIIVPDVNYI